jgi:plastocyanin
MGICIFVKTPKFCSMKKIYTILFSALMLLSVRSTAETITINQTNNTFNPMMANVNVGDVIHFVWSSGFHNTTSVTVPNGADTWEASLDTNNPTFDYTVEVAGTYAYVCTFHAPNMAGGFIASVASSITESTTIASSFTAGVDLNNDMLHVNISNYQASMATLALIDITGKEVAMLLERELGIGEQSFHFDLAGRTSGVYFVQLSQNGHVVTRRILLN